MKPRVILDTNVFVSALLFEGSVASLVPLWKGGALIFILTRSILEEYLRVLAYPRFQLKEDEITDLIADELLPFVETVIERQVKVPPLSDPEDEKFLVASLLGKADFLISGDKVLLKLKKFKTCKILTPSEFLKIYPPVQNSL